MIPALPIEPKVSGQGVVTKKDGTVSKPGLEWTRCDEYLPMPDESPNGYFWGWNESNPDNPPFIYEAWERDGVPQGFCHEASGTCHWVTHWMPAIPPQPPSNR